MNIPFINFRPQVEAIKDEVFAGLSEVFERGDFILGKDEKQFEVDFARYCDSQYAVGVNSGTDALYLGVSAYDIRPGDEVILPSFTFIATALCISYCGAKPVFVDIEDETYNIDPDAFRAAITEKTKAVIPVHLYGQPANMEDVNTIAREKGIKVIEDAAQSHGATYKGKKVGSLGDMSCFSFYPTKSLGGFGDGGMMVTSDAAVNEKVLMLRDYGRQGRYEHKIKGYNSRLDTVQAVVLAAKLKRLDEWNKMRNQVATWYAQELSELSGVILPKIKEDRTHVFQTYAVRIKDRRDEVLEALKGRGVSVLIHYPIPVHLQEAYKDAGYTKGDLPVCESVANEILSLPMFPHMTREEVRYVSDNLKEIMSAKV